MVDPLSIRVDPAQIAYGNDKQAIEAAKQQPNAQGPACAASLESFRSALLFKNVFTILVAILGAVAVVAIGFSVIAALISSWDPANTFAAITGGITGAGALFVQKHKSSSEKLLRDALKDVGTYCGTEKRDELKS
jgi:hypothetical protein